LAANCVAVTKPPIPEPMMITSNVGFRDGDIGADMQ
jgi:hypothetical protein